MTIRDEILNWLKAKPSMTIRELRDLLGVRSTNTVWYHLKRMQEAGRIEKGRCGSCGAARWRVR